MCTKHSSKQSPQHTSISMNKTLKMPRESNKLLFDLINEYINTLVKLVKIY